MCWFVPCQLSVLPYEPDEIPEVIGTFSIEATFDKDPLASGKPINGVNANMIFSSLDGIQQGVTTAHGATVTSSAIKKIQEVLGQLGPYANKTSIQGKWAITETKDGFKFTRIPELNKGKKKK